MINILVMGIFFAHKIKEEENCKTVGDILAKYYGERARFLAGLATLGQSLAFTGVLCLGGAKVLSAVWNIPIEYGVLGIAVIVGTYSSLGGISAVLKTDVGQFLSLVLVLIVGIFSIFLTDAEMPINNANYLWWNYIPKDFPPSSIVGIGLAFLLGEAFIPIYSTRGFIAKDTSSAKGGFILAGIFGIIWFTLLTIIGVVAHKSPSITESNIPVLFQFVYDAFPKGPIGSMLGIGVLAAGILGIIMSTMDSVLNSGAVSASRDIIGSFIELSEEDELNYDKMSLLAISFFGIVFAYFSSDLVSILLIGYTFWVPTIVWPLAYCLIKKKPPKSRRSGWLGILAGVMGYIVFEYFSIDSTITRYIPSLVFGLIFNIAAFSVSEVFSSGQTSR